MAGEAALHLPELVCKIDVTVLLFTPRSDTPLSDLGQQVNYAKSEPMATLNGRAQLQFTPKDR